MSNTSFTEILAVPHPITVSAQRSFACVLHNDEPIPWNDQHKVNFVIMIGMAKGDTRYFQDILDLIIDLFLSPEKSRGVLRTDTFEEFIAVLTT
jgi:mannitol/fructose-specific phosphotransferase system IIA component (Ntr-type)